MLPGYSNIKDVKKAVITLVFFVITVFFVSQIFSSDVVFAQQPDAFGLEQIGETTSLGSEDIRVTIAKIIRAVLGFLGVIALCIMLYAGYLIMTAGGNEQKVTEGKKWMINGVIGLAIILSSFAIVQFVINALGKATGLDPGLAGQAGAPRFDSFSGSGSLGRIIADHYPARNQTGVKRNTKIVVTFNEAVDPASVVDDTNGNGVFGDCVEPQAGDAFSWERHCDHIKIQSVRIAKEGDMNVVWQAAGLALREGENGEVFTLTFRPFDNLGSEVENVWHTVRLIGGGDGIKKASGENVFANSREDYYEWRFETDTTIDTEPPYVVRVVPSSGKTVSKNHILQIHFSEAMDPTQVQGRLAQNGTFTNIVLSNQDATGDWRIVNGYRTVEFVSDEACGQNSCGDQVYCLPVNGESEEYTALIRTARKIAGTFEAVPFSGAMDMAGNALDGDNNKNIADGKPEPVGARNILPNELIADNHAWKFTVLNKVELTAPYVQQVTPGIDAESIIGEEPVFISFSTGMWFSTLRGVSLEEFSAEANRDADVREKIQAMDDMWFKHDVDVEQEKTTLAISHREFGPNNLDLFYFPSVPSTVKDLTQNCVYPGRGPYTEIQGFSPVCEYVEGGDLAQGHCTSVIFDSALDTSCVETLSRSRDDVRMADIQTCKNKLKNFSSGVFAP
ncbi:MAG: hypothetical protein V1652_03655 [bacterium]